MIANVHPVRHAATYPTHIVGRLGWHTADTGCPIGPGTFAAACAATDVAATAAQMVLDGEDAVYALCRPPGHHAFRDVAGGFCFLNNSAVAAAHLRLKHERVAILDVDVHHGNGTQGIFYERPDVLTVSIHADPAFYYPYVWGYAHERGEGEGLGANLNIPLPSVPRMTAISPRSMSPKKPSARLRPARSWSRSASTLPSTIRSRALRSPPMASAASAQRSRGSDCRRCWCRKADICRTYSAPT